MTVKEKISALLADLNTGIYEKEEVMALALLSSIAGESIFLLGPPGVAKSLIARRLKYAYKDGSAFEYLMSRFSTPDEIFGPVSISKLKDEDKYVRIVENYLPSATVVFLDEIWKAGPSIQNALLTVLNEKKFRNGEKEDDIPMKALISASNELPAKDEGLEALWDRFLVRLVVEGIEDKETFNKMISEDLHSYNDTVPDRNKITDKEYENWDADIKAIKIPENVFNVIHVIRASIAEHNQKDDNADKQIYISDRRWRKIIRLLRTSAFLNNRDEVDLMDCFLIRHCLWNEETERDTVYQFVTDAVEEHGHTVDISNIEKELKDIDDDVREWTKGEKPVKSQEPKGYEKTRMEMHPYVKPAHPDTIKGWDKRIKTVQTRAGTLKSQIDSYRTHDLKHIHTNIFVDKEYADIVEANLNDLEKQIEKCEIETNRIYSCYHNIEPRNDSSENKLLEELE
jgi:MoxR-like ATPase